MGDSLDVAAAPERRDLLCSDQARVGLRMTVRAVAARRWLGEGVEGEQGFVESPLEPPGQEVQLLRGKRVTGGGGHLGDHSQKRLLVEAFVDDSSFETVLEDFG